MSEVITLHSSQATMPTTVPSLPFSGLRSVTLRLLWDCNLRCIMCDHPHKPKKEMSLETANKVLDQLPHPVRFAFIGGEPCLWLLRYPEVMQRALDEGHCVHVTTNGILLPRLTAFVDAFRDKPVSVQFSIDGYEESYERIRKRSSWPKLVEAIRAVQSKRREGNNSNAVILVNYLLMKSTLADLPTFVRFCAKEGIDYIHLTYTMIYDSMVKRGEITEEESVYHWQEATNDAVGEAIEVALETGISLCYPPPLGSPSVTGIQWVGPRFGTPVPGKSLVPNKGKVLCSKPWKEIWVSQDGTLIPCCLGPTTGPVIGNIDEGLANVWNGERVQDVRQTIEGGEMHSNCHCGINISEVGRQSGKEYFFSHAQSI